MKNIFFNMVMVVVAVCIAGLLGEGLLVLKNRDMQNYDIEMWRYAKLLKTRSANPKLGHEHAPNRQATLQSVQIRTNNWGLRGPDIQTESPKKRRILFLGSSVTLGWGVPEDQTLPAMIGAELGDDVEVLNAGIGNYNMVKYIELFFSKLTPLKPTDIVLDFFIADPGVRKSEQSNWLLAHSQLAVVVWHIYNGLVSKDSSEDMVSYYKSLYDPNSSGYRDMVKALDRIKAYADANGIRLYLIITPEIYYLGNYLYGFAHEAISKEAQSRGIKYIDPLPAFEGIHDPKTLWAMPTDHHPNAKANRIITDYCINNNFFKIQ
jgi:lysophospholipase L1-like esterase